jgi:hypothetical protein
MADYTDVQNAMVALAASAIYPNGTGAASATGLATYIYAGWPNAQQLNSDLAALNAGTGGRIHVSVFATNIERDVSRYFPWQSANGAAQTTLTATVAGSTLTIGGTVSVPQNVVVCVARVTYAYPVQAGDTLASIAAALAALIPGASSAGAVVTTSSPVTYARVGGSGTVLTEQGRVARTFRTTVWAHTPGARASTAIAIDQAFRQMPFITLADGTQARMKYRASAQDDVPQRDEVYRRDIDYEIEFALTIAAILPAVAAIGLQETVNQVPLTTVYE